MDIDAAPPARHTQIVRLSLALLAAALLCGCDSYHFQAGLLDEQAGRIEQALEHYEAFVARAPADARAAEMHVRAGRLYAQMQRCGEARHHFEAAARAFPLDEPWATRARDGIMSCPDYFPLDAGRRWVYGDSASRGRAMRLEWTVTASSATGAQMMTALYAGDRRLREDRPTFQISGWTIWQRDADGRYAVLEFPYSAGRSWTAWRGKRKLVYSIESASATARTAAGDFSGCLKVRETDASYPDAWKYDYYCPSIGRALTTVAGPGFENPNTELLSYR